MERIGELVAMEAGVVVAGAEEEERALEAKALTKAAVAKATEVDVARAEDLAAIGVVLAFGSPCSTP